MRQMTLVAFLQAQNCTNFASSWRHPLSRTDTWSPDYYRHIGHVLEAGKFHLGFFDDRLSMPDMYGRDHAHTVQLPPRRWTGVQRPPPHRGQPALGRCPGWRQKA